MSTPPFHVVKGPERIPAGSRYLGAGRVRGLTIHDTGAAASEGRLCFKATRERDLFTNPYPHNPHRYFHQSAWAATCRPV